MTEEEIKALQDAKEAAERRVAEVEAAAQLARQEAEKAKEDVSKVVNELTEERRKKNEALSKLNINNGEPDVNTLIEQALQTKEQERRKQELEAAIAEFKSSKSEFQSDSAGLVFGKFQEELKKFNLSDVTNKEQAKKRLEEVYRFINYKSTNPETPIYDGTPTDINNPPVKDARLSQIDEAALKTAGITPEKFTQLKSKYPDALNGLGIN